MANNIVLNVQSTFNMETFSKKLADTYVAKGYTVSVANMNNSSVITFEKGVGGVNYFFGMDEGIKATITKNENGLIINFSDAAWIGKIIAFIATICLFICGLFFCPLILLCLVPLITGVIGVIKQTSLPKSIGNDATMIASSL